MKYYKLIALFFILASLFCFKSNANNRLIGKRICLDYRDPNVMSKYISISNDGKKSSSNNSNSSLSIIGQPITIGDEYYYKKGEEYKEAYCISFECDGQEGILFFPMYIKYDKFSLDDRTVYNAKDKHYEKMSKGYYYHFTPDDISLQYIDCEEIDAFNEKYLNKFVYPVRKAYKIVELPINEDKYYEDNGYNSLFFYQKYQFLGFEFVHQSVSYGKGYYYFYAKFQKNGTIINYPIKPIGDQNSKSILLSDLGEKIVLDNEYIDYCKSIYSSDHLNEVINKYNHQDIHVNETPRNIGIFRIENLNDDVPMDNTSPTIRGNYHVEDIRLMPSIRKEEPYQYFAIISDLKSSELYAFPFIQFEDYIELKSERDQRISDEEIARKKALDERVAKQMQANKERLNKLVKAYGRTNGEIIFDGEVNIGFSKDMCREAWGSPISIDTTTTKNGKREFWYYGDGQYLIFEGNKLVLIHESE